MLSRILSPKQINGASVCVGFVGSKLVIKSVGLGSAVMLRVWVSKHPLVSPVTVISVEAFTLNDKVEPLC